MKKHLFKILFFMMIFTGFSAVGLTAHKKLEESNVYYVNTQIMKIFAATKGYYVIYRREGLKTGEVFIPHEWFKPSDGRAKIDLVNNRIAPYLSFYVKEGKFDFVRVVAPLDLNHSAWGLLKSYKEYDSKFENIEALELKF